jgi:hypothetical protein
MQVLLQKTAAKYLERLNEPNKSNIKDALEDLSKDPPSGDIRPLNRARRLPATQRRLVEMTGLALRKKIHSRIDTMTDRKLYALEPLITLLDETEPLIIETDLTDEERAIIAEGDRQFKEDPSSFVPLESIG